MAKIERTEIERRIRDLGFQMYTAIGQMDYAWQANIDESLKLYELWLALDEGMISARRAAADRNTTIDALAHTFKSRGIAAPFEL